LGRGVVGRRLESGLHQKDQQTESTCPASGVACGLHAPSTSRHGFALTTVQRACGHGRI
jgi:hypothetical protein